MYISLTGKRKEIIVRALNRWEYSVIYRLFVEILCSPELLLQSATAPHPDVSAKPDGYLGRSFSFQTSSVERFLCEDRIVEPIRLLHENTGPGVTE